LGEVLGAAWGGFPTKLIQWTDVFSFFKIQITCTVFKIKRKALVNIRALCELTLSMIDILYDYNSLIMNVLI
jgi:hypothetical protein